MQSDKKDWPAKINFCGAISKHDGLGIPGSYYNLTSLMLDCYEKSFAPKKYRQPGS